MLRAQSLQRGDACIDVLASPWGETKAALLSGIHTAAQPCTLGTHKYTHVPEIFKVCMLGIGKYMHTCICQEYSKYACEILPNTYMCQKYSK